MDGILEMYNAPKISVIVPIYNVENFVKKCVSSILNQTYKNLEIILVDDGSTDNSSQIIDVMSKEDSRIKCIHKTNGGLSDARNSGIAIATGEYIGFVDGDDWIHPQMYEILYQKLRETNTDICCCEYMSVDENLFCEKRIISEIKSKVYDKTFAMTYVGDLKAVAWNKLYKKKLFEQLRYPYGKIHEDEYVIHRLIYLCNKICLIDCPLYFYVQRSDSIMGTKSIKSIYDALGAWDDRIEFIKNNWAEMLENVVGACCEYLIDRYYSYDSEKSKLKMIYKQHEIKIIRENRFVVHKKYIIFAFSPTAYKFLVNINLLKEKLINHIYGIYKKRIKRNDNE